MEYTMVNMEGINEAVREVEESLVNGDYKKYSNEENKGRLTEEQIKNVIEKHPGNLTLSPIEEYNSIKVLEVKNTLIPTSAIDFDLWFDNKQGDLTLQLTITKELDGALVPFIEDIHTL